MRRGEIWWASLPNPLGSGPAYRRPVVVIQSDTFNESRLHLFHRSTADFHNRPPLKALHWGWQVVIFGFISIDTLQKRRALVLSQFGASEVCDEERGG